MNVVLSDTCTTCKTNLQEPREREENRVELVNMKCVTNTTNAFNIRFAITQPINIVKLHQSIELEFSSVPFLSQKISLGKFQVDRKPKKSTFRTNFSFFLNFKFFVVGHNFEFFRPNLFIGTPKFSKMNVIFDANSKHVKLYVWSKWGPEFKKLRDEEF